jgi:flagellar M-ring protein FliF
MNINNMDGIKNFLMNGAARQLLFMVGVAVSVALGIVLYMSIQDPVYRPLDYQVNSQNISAIADTLDKAGIQYKINDKDGLIFVAAKDVQSARMKLGAAGIPKDDSINYSFLNEKNTLGNSQFMENARYLRALENDLARTISAIEGVSGARVHIAVPQNNLFADENNKTTASVMLSVGSGFSSNKEKIHSIVQLVAGSVPGLDAKDVAITDQYGHYLSNGIDQNSIYSAAQLSYQNNVQSYYEKRVESMLSSLIGEDKVSVRVNADIDFTQQENAQEEYDPSKSAVISEKSDIDQTDNASAAASGVPGALSNTPDDSQAGQTSSGGQQQGANGNGNGSGAGAGNNGSGGQKRTQSTKNYDVSKTVTYKKSNFAKIKMLSVAVIIDDEMVMDPKTKKFVSKPLPQEKINKITELVKATVGFDQARGDKVTVVNSVFTPPKADLTIVTHVWDQVWFWDVLRKSIGMICGFILLFFIYKRLANYMKNLGKGYPNIAQRISNPDVEETAAEIKDSKDEKIHQLKKLATTDPNRVASIIKSWVGKQ